MKVKIAKEEIKDIDEIVEVPTAEEDAITPIPPPTEAEPELVSITDLSDRELLEDTYLAVMEIRDLLKKGAKPVTSSSSVPVGEKKKRAPNANKMSKAEKEGRGKELVDGGPYNELQLKAMTRRDLLLYAKAMKLGKEKAFGKATPELIANVLEAQE